MQRKYSLDEIDRMLAAVKFLFKERPSEEALRTYMMNGTEPEELEGRVEAQQAKWREEKVQVREWQARRS